MINEGQGQTDENEMVLGHMANNSISCFVCMT